MLVRCDQEEASIASTKAIPGDPIRRIGLPHLRIEWSCCSHVSRGQRSTNNSVSARTHPCFILLGARRVRFRIARRSFAPAITGLDHALARVPLREAEI